MIEQLLAAGLIAVLTGAVNGVVTLALLKLELRHLRREAVRAHLRLDKIGAPNVTLEDAA